MYSNNKNYSSCKKVEWNEQVIVFSIVHIFPNLWIVCWLCRMQLKNFKAFFCILVNTKHFWYIKECLSYYMVQVLEGVDLHYFFLKHYIWARYEVHSYFLDHRLKCSSSPTEYLGAIHKGHPADKWRFRPPLPCLVLSIFRDPSPLDVHLFHAKSYCSM